MKRDHEAVLEELAQAVGRRVRELRLARPAAQSTLVALSRSTGMSVSFLSMIENGHRLPSLGALVALSRALDIAPSRLLAVTGETGARLPGDPPDRPPASLDAPVPHPSASASRQSLGEDPAAVAELLEPVAAFFRSRGLGERELGELLEAARKLFT
ncbi:MAG: helix-turn-helix domain-containing protein [Myxococcales bacterium]